MKVLICGSSNLPKDNYPIYYVADAYYKSGFKASEIIAIDRRKIGMAAEEFAKEKQIPFNYIYSIFDINAEAVIALWDGSSTRTFEIIKAMKMNKRNVYIYETKATVSFDSYL